MGIDTMARHLSSNASRHRSILILPLQTMQFSQPTCLCFLFSPSFRTHTFRQLPEPGSERCQAKTFGNFILAPCECCGRLLAKRIKNSEAGELLAVISPPGIKTKILVDHCLYETEGMGLLEYSHFRSKKVEGFQHPSC